MSRVDKLAVFALAALSMSACGDTARLQTSQSTSWISPTSAVVIGADLSLTEVLGNDDQGAMAGVSADNPNAPAERRDYTKGGVPGSIGAKRKLKAGSTAGAGQYTYTQVDVPGAVFTGLFGINSRGQTVGQ